MMRYAFALLLLAGLVPATGCAVGPSCAGSCGVGYDSCGGCGSCGTGELRARNPLHHLRTLGCSGGCGEVYWGEWPDPNSRCDTCSTGRRPGGWADLWGVRRRNVAARVSSGGCTECGHASEYEGMVEEGTVIYDGPTRSAPPVENVPPAPKPERALPGPDDTTQRSIIRPNVSQRSPGQRLPAASTTTSTASRPTTVRR